MKIEVVPHFSAFCGYTRPFFPACFSMILILYLGGRIEIRLFPGPLGCILPNIPKDKPVSHPFEGIGVEKTSEEDPRLGIIFLQIGLVEALNFLCRQELGIHDGVHEILFS